VNDKGQNQGARVRHATGGARQGATMVMEDVALSFIRTVTVGPGIQPGLLTPARGVPGARGLVRTSRHHRRWGISPRPENAAAGSHPPRANDNGPAENPQSAT